MLTKQYRRSRQLCSLFINPVTLNTSTLDVDTPSDAEHVHVAGIIYVIDPGFSKQKSYNPRTGVLLEQHNCLMHISHPPFLYFDTFSYSIQLMERIAYSLPYSMAIHSRFFSIVICILLFLFT